jgi:hypothetical protein
VSDVVTSISVQDVITTYENSTEVLSSYGLQGAPGPVGPAGPAGPPGANGASGERYLHVQVAPAATWIIEHNLGRRPPVVLLIEGDDFPSYADVTYVSLDTLSIELPEPLAGIAEM